MSIPTTDRISTGLIANITASITATFRRVLEIDDVGTDDEFFALGGDSLLATRVLSAIAREYGVELTFDEFVLAATPAALGRLVARPVAGARP